MKNKHSYSSDDAAGYSCGGMRLPCPWFFRLQQPDDYASVDEMRKPLYFIVDDVSSQQVREFEDSKEKHKVQQQPKPTTRPSLPRMCTRGIPFRRRQANRRRHDSETASLTRVESMTITEQPKQISNATTPEETSRQEELSLNRYRGLRWRVPDALYCRKGKKHDDAESSTSSAEEIRRFDGNDPTSILGVSFPHPAFLLKNEIEEETKELEIEKKHCVPVQQRTNKLNLKNTVVQTMAVDSWGSETSSYPSDEESGGEGTFDFSDDEAPFDEVEVRPSFDTSSIVDSESEAQRLIEIGDTDRGVHYFYKDDYDVDSLPWIEHRESSGALEFRPETLCSMLDSSSLLQRGGHY